MADYSSKSNSGSGNMYKGTHPKNSSMHPARDRVKTVKNMLSSRNDDARQRDNGPLMAAVNRSRRGPFSGTGFSNKGTVGSSQGSGGRKLGHIETNSKPGKMDLDKPTSVSGYKTSVPHYDTDFGTRTGGNATRMGHGLGSNPRRAGTLNPNSRNPKYGGNGVNKGSTLTASYPRALEIPGSSKPGLVSGSGTGKSPMKTGKY